mgnify:CR=1 FL=1
MTQSRFRQTTAALVALTLVLSVFGPVGTVAAQSVSVSNSPSSTTVAPGDTVTITTTISGADINGQGMNAQLPSGWVGEVTDADGGAAKPSSGTANVLEVIWFSNGAYEVTYEVQVPSDATDGTYTITAEGSGIDPGDVNDPDDDTRLTDTATTTITVQEPTQDPANFQVSNLNAPASATVGDTVDVSATVENTGGTEATQTVEFVFGGSVVDSQQVTLSAGGTQEVSFAADTTGTAAGTYTHGVTTDDDGATAQITLSDPATPANFQVSNLNAPASVTQGDTATVTATVTNTGDLEATQTVDFEFDGSVLDSQDVTLAGGSSQQVSFTVDTTGVAADTYAHGVYTDDDSATAQILVEEPAPEPDPANFEIPNLSTPGTVTQGDTTTVTATVENTGDEEGTQTVSLSINGTQADGQSVTLAGGASQQVSFSVDTSGLSVGPQTIEVSTDDATATGAMFVDAAAEPPTGTVDVSLEPADQTAAPGDIVTYDVVVTGADGVGSVEGLTVSLSNVGAASIVDVDTPAGDANEEIVSTDQSVTISAFGLSTDSSGQVTIATITVSADAEGDTDLTIADDGDLYVSDEQGSGYTVGNTTDATLSVGLPPVVGDNSPANLDDDNVLEDVNGDGEFNVGDAQALFYNRDSPVVQENVEYFDFNGDGIVNVGDAQAIFYEVVLSGN